MQIVCLLICELKPESHEFAFKGISLTILSSIFYCDFLLISGNPFASATITMDKSNEPESIESYLNRLSSAKLPSNLDERRNSSKLSWTNINGITTTWLIVIIIIAAIAFLIIIGCCYICLFKGKQSANRV